MNLDTRMKRFRLASRELFNHYFHNSHSSAEDADLWRDVERFQEVQEVLFEKIVTEPLGILNVRYGPNPKIKVELNSDFAPIMLNRDIDSGYWDNPIKEITKSAELFFLYYFDWDQLGYRDNEYVRVFVNNWYQNPATIGKHGLISAQLVHYVLI